MAKKTLQTVAGIDGVPSCQTTAQPVHHSQFDDKRTQSALQPNVKDNGAVFLDSGS
jgi:hypothetical protein